ncbi:MAG: DUF1501 domain-containing protein [Cytophagales bacterium]|nr:MAG: DUF1501 domain-containing protein [Cytophagales bacterium]
MNRRAFLNQFSLLSGSVAVGLGGIQLRAFAHPLLLDVQSTNGKVLVLVQLTGGNDGLNTLIPFEDSLYYNSRPQIAIPKAQVLRLDNNMGFHPSMGSFKELYEGGKMKIMQSVGYENQNRSHFRSTDIWLSASNSDEFLFDGWLGRFLSHSFPEFPSQSPKHPMAIELGSTESMLLQSPTGPTSIAFDTPNAFFQLVSGSMADNDPPPATLAGDELKYLKQIAANSIKYANVIKSTADKVQNKVTYPNTSLGRQLSIVADLVAGGMETPVYLTTIGGFDTHAQQLPAHANLLKTLTEAIAAFQKDIELLGIADKVALMTFSEFGRRVKENGSAGTDHGSAAPMFIIGQTVKSGTLGKNPSLTDLDNNGDIKHQHDFKSVYSTILQDYFGLAKNDAKGILNKDFEKYSIFRNVKAPKPSTNLIELVQNYPNPFSQTTKIEYNLTRKAEVRFVVMDMLGRELTSISQGLQDDGYYSFDFQDNNLADGIYLYSIQADDQRVTKRMMIVR